MIPSFVLNRLYASGSLKNANGGVQFEFVNGLLDIGSVALLRLAIDGEPVALDQVRIEVTDAAAGGHFEGAQPFPFPLRCKVTILALGRAVAKARHGIDIGFEARPYGILGFTFEDEIAEGAAAAETQLPEAAPEPAAETDNCADPALSLPAAGGRPGGRSRKQGGRPTTLPSALFLMLRRRASPRCSTVA